ncbi:MAG: UvrB/UvrC motif-containing protein [Parcubacteria group bacterium]|nr:UvrB/UvrC motif-containing protein [Parcubacteria group bacterium]
MSIFIKKFKRLPDAPGVYFFLGKRKKSQGPSLRLFIHSREVLYIGKAGSLRDRVRSYFARDIVEARGAGIEQMVEKAEDIAYEKTDSVLEAVLLEAELIRKYQPKYNVREKDDKSFNYVVITKEEYPRVLTIRGRELVAMKISNLKSYILNPKYTFGPFPQGGTLREALAIIRKIFPYRDAKCKPNQGRPCFNWQIGLCPGVCVGAVSKKEYAKTIRNISFLFKGKKKSLLATLVRDMRAAAKAREFERAMKLRNTIFSLKHIQDVSLIKRERTPFESNFESNYIYGRSSVYKVGRIRRIEAYDVAHISGKEIVGVMVTIYGGEPDKSAYRKFKIRTVLSSNDTAALKEVLERRLTHAEWPFPDLIVIDGGKAQMNIAARVLKESGLETPVVGVVKDERHRPKHIIGNEEARKEFENEILLANSEAHRFAIGYHRERMRRRRGNVFYIVRATM